MTEASTCMSYWFPRVVEAGVPHPRTEMVSLSQPEQWALMAQTMAGEGWPTEPDQEAVYGAIVERLVSAAMKVSDTGPWFLRNAHFSGKHNFESCCMVRDVETIGRHACAIVYEGECANMFGFPIEHWFVREYLDVAPLFRAFGGTPIVREFRLFAKDGVVHQWQPYWPADSILNPDDPYWVPKLAEASLLGGNDARVIGEHARAVTALMPGVGWSVDMLQDAKGKWWLTDMALESTSYKSPEVAAWFNV